MLSKLGLTGQYELCVMVGKDEYGNWSHTIWIAYKLPIMKTADGTAEDLYDILANSGSANAGAI